ncbi:YycH family regulatory protein [Bacillaceae bacterium W0354]
MIEHIKTIVLFLLIATSLLLTVAIWNYQPQYEPLGQMDYLEETQLDGEQKSIRTLIKPKQIIFHNYLDKRQIATTAEVNSLYEEILNWDFASVDPYMSTKRSMWQQTMEVIFPTDIPVDLISRIFLIDKLDYEYGETFDRMYFQLSQTTQDIRVTFLSSKHDQVLNGVIQSSRAYQIIKEKMGSAHTVPVRQFVINNKLSIYLPTEEVEVDSHALLTDNVDLLPLRNVLFKNPSLVRAMTTTGYNDQEYYTDGTRALTTKRVFRNDRIMEYVNPLSSDSESMSTIDVIRKSVNFTNDHYGWTDDYLLDEVDTYSNTVKYRMYYEGLPIFENYEITDIIQTWRNNELYEMKRPLFQTSTQFHNEQQLESLQSGEWVIQFLTNHRDQISFSMIEDIRIGYKLETRSEISNVLILKPEWHIKYRGEWRPISYFTSMLINRGDE